MTKRYTQEQIKFLELIVPGKNFSKATELFNLQFDTEKTVTQIKELCKRKKIRSGLDMSFKKGCERTASVAHESAHPLGHETVTSDGYVKVKIGVSPSVWKLKQVVVWEKYKGGIPNGHVVVFLDGNKKNCCINNLTVVPKNYISRINRMRLEYFNDESFKACCLIADLKTKINSISIESDIKLS